MKRSSEYAPVVVVDNDVLSTHAHIIDATEHACKVRACGYVYVLRHAVCSLAYLMTASTSAETRYNVSTPTSLHAGNKNSIDTIRTRTDLLEHRTRMTDT